MDGEDVTPMAQWDLAFAKKAALKHVEYDSGMKLLRMTIREGKRITDVNFHGDAARQIGKAMIDWADAHEE